MTLQANNISLRYSKNQKIIIQNQSLQFKSGKINVILGPNGCGKSTIFKAFAKQIKPFSGNITLNDFVIDNILNKEFSKKIGIMFQQHGNALDLTTKDILNISRYAYLNLFDQLKNSDKEKIQKAMQLTNIKQFQNTQIRNLSSGQRQLVWIAMLIAQDSEYMFFDQPTTFLDLTNQFEIMNCLQKINKELHKTIIIILHDINLAAQYADVIFLMNKGKIVSHGQPKNVLTQQNIDKIFHINVKIFQNNGHILVCPIR